VTLAEYEFAVRKALAGKYRWTGKMLDRRRDNIRTYAEAYLAREPTK
jgi:hypothetical protein